MEGGKDLTDKCKDKCITGEGLVLAAFYSTYQPSRNHEGKSFLQKEYKNLQPRNVYSGSKPDRNWAEIHPLLILSQSLGLMFLTN